MSNENKQPDERAAFVRSVQMLAFLCRTEPKRLDDETLKALGEVEDQLVALGLSVRNADGELSTSEGRAISVRAAEPQAVAPLGSPAEGHWGEPEVPSDGHWLGSDVDDGHEIEQAEEMVRFCPECGSLGFAPAPHLDCCPDGSHARMVPKRFAEICRDTFKMAIHGAPTELMSDAAREGDGNV
ncbi:hypothetical protein G3N59_01040 [Paraburkholderia sp. Ac-20340]|uniref:hypothetical protein n=1 Tax=Paraburkholderia sp. Ac-20340 TaxID=2703888 RepID=UPI00197FCD22|nr:hypothetical protein [Paraburkholderia sp. Ac-20340]MBN3851952.1 hypothetical protein [Paraburkholderia sp. Ac-20340]